MFEKVDNHVSRLIFPLQSTGQVGKSTVLSSIIEYLKVTNIEYQAIDADGEHNTLSTWYSKANYIPFREKNDLLAVLGALGEQPVQIVDFPAQATTSLLRSIIDFDAISYLSQKGIRVTVVLFANQDQAGMIAASDIFRTLGRTVDYLLVENPIKFGSTGFWRSKLGESFENDPRLKLSTLPDETVYEINLASKKQNQVFNFIEAIQHLHGLHRSALLNWKKEVFTSLHKSARVLLPAGYDVKENKEFRTVETVRSNPLDLY